MARMMSPPTMARVHEGVRTVASVNVYTLDSAEPETRPASIKAKPVKLEISKKPPLTAAKLVYKDGKTSRATRKWRRQ